MQTVESTSLYLKGDSVVGINRKGLAVSALPDTLIAAVSALPFHEVLLDGEAFEERMVVFELLALQETPESEPLALKAQTVAQRQQALDHIPLTTGVIDRAKTATTTQEKRDLLKRATGANGEGIVFKRRDAVPLSGRHRINTAGFL